MKILFVRCLYSGTPIIIKAGWLIQLTSYFSIDCVHCGYWMKQWRVDFVSSTFVLCTLMHISSNIINTERGLFGCFNWCWTFKLKLLLKPIYQTGRLQNFIAHAKKKWWKRQTLWTLNAYKNPVKNVTIK